ncbi:MULTISPECIES: sulfonate ABC transporter substrate-binding protein [unclassified Leptolyngbya]|uniref:sulfonate ABC transporter substrate-binding protein n=1 Tax=unclassified Leptolyngbya TaxID=2650499 RepID=UPI001684CD55|nr:MULTISPECIES: sulfonate ABC transporter substrate-binding protein [unclassified Leptolyngbya]MBD1909918.1 sulfonate ABC transporter substrate-binding protein [Leptolyngbya sp. FACHB-8]MBD2158618.1 sulfonate ABC transporter substrate-binding protein [Leptolyngbya sp. FACHB-16]
MQRWFRPRYGRAIALFLAGLALSFGMAACAPTPSTSTASPEASAPPSDRVVRIGHQKFDPFTLVKARGGLEERLKPLGVTVEWTEFQSGPPMMEALNVGSIDIGRTGDTPPVFAQAADAPLVYIGSGSPKASSSAIVVPKDSPLKTVADLKGKKVGFQKGSSAHYLTVQALKSAGLKWEDIEPVNLTPADARSAFSQGAIDAWGIWDPFYAAAEAQLNAKTLILSEGLAANRDFYLASKTFANQNADVIEAIAQETREVSEWASANPAEVVKILSPILGIDPPILDKVTRRRDYTFQAVKPEVIEEQQAIADTFFELGLLPKALKVSDIVWQPS